MTVSLWSFFLMLIIPELLGALAESLRLHSRPGLNALTTQHHGLLILKSVDLFGPVSKVAS